MIAAMVVGMTMFYPLLTWVLDRLGRGDLLDAAIPTALVMATSMTLGMSIWMAIRRHSWRFILEMGAAMYLSSSCSRRTGRACSPGTACSWSATS
jgi:hypothetical protein